MTRAEYWEEAFAEIVYEFEKSGLFTKEEIQKAGKSLEIYADQQSMAFGTPQGRPRKDPEIAGLEKRIRELEEERDRAIRDFQKNVAMRRGCDVNEVRLLGNGHAEYR